MYAAGMMYSPDHTTKMMMTAAAAQSVSAVGKSSMSHAAAHHVHPPPLGSPLSAAAASAGVAMAAANGFGAAAAAAATAGGGGGRYSPTYRVPDQMRDPMRRCMTNPPVSETNSNTGLPAYSDSVGTAKRCHCKQTVTGIGIFSIRRSF